MCLIAVTPRRNMIPRDYLENARDHNSDGWGFMYAREGRVIAHKSTEGMNVFFDAWESIPGETPCAVHFRFGTSGPKDGEACHPFKILDFDESGVDLYLMHNGVLSSSGFRGDSKQSDTQEMVETVLRPVLLKAPGLIREPGFILALDKLIGGGNKLVFLDGTGKFHFVNRSAGTKRKKIWYSNAYSLEKVYSGHGKGRAASHDDDVAPYRYDSGVWRSSLVPQEAKTCDQRCESCTGKYCGFAPKSVAPCRTCYRIPCECAPRVFCGTCNFLRDSDGKCECDARKAALNADWDAWKKQDDMLSPWNAWNMETLSEAELFQMVCDQPDEATDFIGDLLGLKWLKKDDAA